MTVITRYQSGFFSLINVGSAFSLPAYFFLFSLFSPCLSDYPVGEVLHRGLSILDLLRLEVRGLERGGD